METNSYNEITRPKQYNHDHLTVTNGSLGSKTIEPLDYVEPLLTGNDFSGFEGAMVKDIIKYVSRFPYKGQPIKDLKKASFYLDRLIKHEEALEEYRNKTSNNPVAPTNETQQDSN